MINQFKKISENKYLIPKEFRSDMLVDGIIFASEKMMKDIIKDNAYVQVVDVACLPGIVNFSLAMPDIHYGYGFPIGGVAAFDPENNGIISPGGVGYDINCGVRTMTTNLSFNDIKDEIEELTYALATQIPSGIGKESSISLSKKDMEKVLLNGAAWAVERGYGEKDDLINSEEYGAMAGANPDMVSSRAKERGKNQLGTLGSGNHFIEIQYVDKIFDKAAAEKRGFFEGQINIMIHSGSRGLGHQVCSDYIVEMNRASQKYGIKLADQQLCCAPIKSEEGQQYFSAMVAAANYAWANRQILMHLIRECISIKLKILPSKLEMKLVYDVAHNIAKMEKHQTLDPRSEIKKEKVLCIHRKGATRAFPGQTVIVPGDMGRYSFIMEGKDKAMKESWGSICHGAGRRLSRHAAAKITQADKLQEELKAKGIIVKAASRKGLIEEAPIAYKDVQDVVEVVELAGLAKKVIKLKPLGVIKG